MHLSIKLMGPFQVLLDDREAVFATDRARALLAYLAVEADRPHRREALANLLWPDRPENLARNNFSQSLTRLRRAIDDHHAVPPFLKITAKTIQFNAGTAELDVARFECMLADCDAHPHSGLTDCPACLERLEAAAGLYRGEFLQGLFLADNQLFEEWALFKREQLHRRALEALDTLTGSALARHTYDRAVRFAEQQLSLEPWREEAHRQMMQALALSGQRSLALVQFKTCCHLLAGELGVEPAVETTALYERILQGKLAPIQHQYITARYNLPTQPTAFVGREKELAGIARLLADPQVRLVTILGPGGIGKTRLAIEAANKHLNDYEDGVWYVPMSSVDPAVFAGSINPLIAALADVFEIAFHSADSPQNQLLAYFQDKETLILFDNCEHLLDSVRLISDLIASLPHLKVLATSRERLNLREEWLFVLEGLDVPTEEVLPSELARYGAIELFRQLAHRVQPQFDLSAESVPVIRICRLVEGMPLGIELAANWVRTMSCQDIADEIERRIDFLATPFRNIPDRHRSLRAVFDHSWRLLSEVEQAVLKKLSVFQGGFQRQAAESVAGASLQLLSSLADKSLLSMTATGRYHIHDLLQQYAAEKLRQAPGDYEQACDLHCLIYLDFLRQQEEDLKGARLKAAMQAITADIDNIRSAWRWGVERERLMEIKQTLFSLWQFYEMKGWYLEAQDVLSRVIAMLEKHCKSALSSKEVLPLDERCLTLGLAVVYKAWFETRLGRYEQAGALFKEGLSILRTAGGGSQQETGLALIFFGAASCIWGEPHAALKPLKKSLKLFSDMDEPWGWGTALSMLGQAYMFLGRHSRAEPLLKEGVAILSRVGNLTNIPYAMSALGHIAQVRGRFLQAEAIYRECLQIRSEMYDRTGMAFTFCDLGEIARLQGAYAQSEQYYQQGLAISKEIGFQAVRAEALRGLGNLAERQGDYAAAKKFFQESLAINQLSGLYAHSPSAVTGIGWAALGLGEVQEAKQHFREALNIEAQTQRQPILLDALAGVAHYLARSGEPERALEFLALVLRHPATFQETKERAISLQACLQAQMQPEQVARTEGRGKERALEEALVELEDRKFLW